MISWQNSGMIIERRRELEFNTEAGRAGGILEIGEARDISNPGEPHNCQDLLHHSTSPKRVKRGEESGEILREIVTVARCVSDHISPLPSSHLK